MPHLTDQVVLITGCSSGIGRALAEAFARRGHRTFASARRLESLDGLSGERMEKLRLDVTDETSIEEAIGSVIERAGRLDMIVNNAGFNVFGPLPEVPLSDFRRLFETNVTGPIAVIQKAFPHMAARRSGRIVNVGSIVGIVPTPFAGAYCATKSALHMLSDVLRVEVKPFGIDVVVVQPGGVRSNISETGSQGLERYAAESSHYHLVYRQIQARANTSQVRPMDTTEFADYVVDAVTRSRAPRVVRAGRGSSLLPALGRLPSPALDRLMTRRFGLDKLERSR